MSPAVSLPSKTTAPASDRVSNVPREGCHVEIQPLTLPSQFDDEYVQRLRAIVAPHLESFNFCMGPGLDMLIDTIAPVTVRALAGRKETYHDISLRYSRLAVMKPRFRRTLSTSVASDTLPNECRRAGISYTGEILAELEVVVNNKKIELPMRRIGRIPVMVGSTKCNLVGKSPSQLLDVGEEEYELGGYFIVNGSEKLVRMIVVPRANSVISVFRDSNLSRGPLYTEVSVSIRCMRRDLSTVTMHMHYMRTGGATVRINVGKTEYFMPVGVIIRALLPSETSARAIFDLIVGGDETNEPLRASALAIVTDLDEWTSRFKPSDHEKDIHVSVSQCAALQYIGRTFRVVLNLRPDASDFDAGVELLRQYVLVHLSHSSNEMRDKFLESAKVDMLVHMVRKLVATAAGAIEVDDADAPSHQELLLPGQLYLSYLKERLEVFLLTLSSHISRELGKGKGNDDGSNKDMLDAIARSLSKATAGDLITKQMRYFLATGNIRSRGGLDLPQTVGYAIIAERINYLRFITHFRCIHRGAFYSNMRSTKVRKLLPEAWGFICPVQTPDGAPSGLLNHLASSVQISQGFAANVRELASLVAELGAAPSPAFSSLTHMSDVDTYPIIADGCVVGYIHWSKMEQFAKQMRLLKNSSTAKIVPVTAEIVNVPNSRFQGSGFYPGIYVHTTSSRMMRPVLWLSEKRRRKADTHNKAISQGDDRRPTGTPELIGTLEQVFLHVRPAVDSPSSSVTSVRCEGASHAEISSESFMSEVASLTPFSDMNQGPRNIFQCQMAKQAMGTPCHNYSTRFDPKVYRLMCPQVPITRNKSMQDTMGADLFPNGVNGIVAVISYTGYDMEDALVLNQGSVNRGFAHGVVYVNKRINLDESPIDKGKQFGPLLPEEANKTAAVDVDGLPCVGARIKKNDSIYATSTLGTSASANSGDSKSLRWINHKSVEMATIDEVQIVNSASYNHDYGQKEIASIREVNIRTRISRAPAVGDKFATRAGQKGTVASIWPAEDMPFSESGIIPDILFNPNGFPSRMTIGMMIETMVGKGGSLHGSLHDSTPFKFDEKRRAVDYFGEQLVRAGYNYYGNETLYSGYTGEPFQVDIFMGVIHYQRLRHMVSDKFQVRSTGAINPLYRQPVGGRKRGGAIRFGEMERDGLLAHGASFLLRDRLAMASDMHVMHVCDRCGSLLTPVHVNCTKGPSISRSGKRPVLICRICDDKKRSEVQSDNHGPSDRSGVQRVAMPYSFKYLVHELAAMNIRTVLDLTNSDEVVKRDPQK